MKTLWSWGGGDVGEGGYLLSIHLSSIACLQNSPTYCTVCMMDNESQASQDKRDSHITQDRKCVSVCEKKKQPMNLHLHEDPGCGMHPFGLNGAGTMFSGKNAT